MKMKLSPKKSKFKFLRYTFLSEELFKKRYLKIWEKIASTWARKTFTKKVFLLLTNWKSERLLTFITCNSKRKTWSLTMKKSIKITRDLLKLTNSFRTRTTGLIKILSRTWKIVRRYPSWKNKKRSKFLNKCKNSRKVFVKCS